MAVAQLYHHCAPRSEVGTVARALMRLLHNHRCVLLLWWLSERICHPYFYVFCFVFMCCFSVHCSDTELVSRTTCVSQQQKCKPFWTVIKQEVMGWQWYRLEPVQTICISLQTDNHVCTSWLNFFVGWMLFLILECGPMTNMMVALTNIGGAVCSTPQFGWRSLLDCRAVTLPRHESRWN